MFRVSRIPASFSERTPVQFASIDGKRKSGAAAKRCLGGAGCNARAAHRQPFLFAINDLPMQSGKFQGGARGRFRIPLGLPSSTEPKSAHKCPIDAWPPGGPNHRLGHGQLRRKSRRNVSGRICLDAACIDCDRCRMVAPTLSSRNPETGFSSVQRQLPSPSDFELAE
jgi:hypothetical protein